jgi:divalent metal cation (Fe/Co/Zn/Cd) transporter
MNAETVALLIAGLIAPWIIQAIKGWLKLQGPAAAWMTLVVSVAIAVIAVAITGGLAAIPWSDPVAAVQALAAIGGVVFTIASLVYKTLGDRAKLGSGRDFRVIE